MKVCDEYQVRWVLQTRPTRTDGVSGVSKEAETEETAATASVQSPPSKAAVLGKQTELIAVCGFPGVGKSTVSEKLRDDLDAKRLRTDAIRKELFDDPTYSTEESRIVYQTAFDRTRETLEAGQTVVFDASFANKRHRDIARQVAIECNVPFRLLKVDCEESEVVRRIEQREDISDADVDVYYQIREKFEAIEQDHFRINNSDSWEQTARQLNTLIA